MYRKKYQSNQTVTIEQNLLNKVQTTYEIWQTTIAKKTIFCFIVACVCVCVCVCVVYFDRIGSFSLVCMAIKCGVVRFRLSAIIIDVVISVAAAFSSFDPLAFRFNIELAMVFHIYVRSIFFRLPLHFPSACVWISVYRIECFDRFTSTLFSNSFLSFSFPFSFPFSYSPSPSLVPLFRVFVWFLVSFRFVPFGFGWKPITLSSV